MVSARQTVLAIILASVCTSSVVLGDAAIKAAAGASAGASSPVSDGNGYQSYYGADSGYAPSSSYGAPAPAKGYGAPAPAKGYGAPAPSYGPAAPAPGYEGYPPGGYEAYRLESENPFVQQRLFNTAVALTVPLFSFQLPQRSAPSGGVDLANQAIFGVFALFVVALVFAVPVLFTKPPGETYGRSNKDGILDHLMANQKVFNFMGADLSNKIGLDTTKCLQKSICEAHRTPKKYGMLATPFQMFFPPPVNGTADVKSSIFQVAAKDGKYSKKDCGKKYSCFFDTLDLASYMVDWWKHSTDPNYVLEL